MTAKSSWTQSTWEASLCQALLPGFRQPGTCGWVVTVTACRLDGREPVRRAPADRTWGWTHRAWFITSLLIKMWFKVLLISEGFKPLPSPQPFFLSTPGTDAATQPQHPLLATVRASTAQGPREDDSCAGKWKSASSHQPALLSALFTPIPMAAHTVGSGWPPQLHTGYLAARPQSSVSQLSVISCGLGCFSPNHPWSLWPPQFRLLLPHGGESQGKGSRGSRTIGLYLSFLTRGPTLWPTTEKIY